MPIFTVYLDADNGPRGVAVNGGGERPLEDFNDEKIRPLILLALMTARDRANPERGGEEDPSLHDLSTSMCDYLAEAVCNRRNFREPGGRMAIRHWLLDLFEVPPRGTFLSATRTAGATRVRFLPEVSVVIEGAAAGDWEALQRIVGLYYSDREFTEQRELVIKVHLPTNGPTELKEISSDVGRGNLVTNIEMWIEVQTNFKAEISVFWVCADSETHWLHPFSDIDGVVGNQEARNGGLLIEIGKDRGMQIYDPSGNEICIALVGEEELSPHDGLVIAEKLRHIFPDTYRAMHLRNARFETRLLNEDENNNNRVRGMGAAPPRMPWREALNELLSPYGEKAYIFTIPHRELGTSGR